MNDETPNANKFSGAIQAMILIKKKEGNNRGVSGEVPCPECGKPFQYSIAKSNGHIHARCSGCGLAFMQ